MCQILDIDSKYTVAEKDLTFYKVLRVVEIHGETKYVLPFMGFDVEIGKTYEEENQKEFLIGHVRDPYNVYYNNPVYGSYFYGSCSSGSETSLYRRCIAEGGFHLFQTEDAAKSFMTEISGGNSVFKLFRAIVPKGTVYVDGYYDLGGPIAGPKFRTVCAKKVKYEFMEARRHRK